MVSPVAMVTGASSGLGLATAVGLAGTGRRVVATVREGSRTTELAAASAASGGLISMARLDVRDRAAAAALVGSLTADGLAIDVLVNNAGVGSFGAVETSTDAELELVMDTNFLAAVAMTRLVLPGMRARRGGTVVNIGSVDGWLPGRPLRWAYAASKHALGTFSEALALEVASFGIRVRQLDPGFHATRIRDNRIARATSPGQVGAEVEAAYADLGAAVDRAMRAGGGAAADPADVARAVVAAIEDRDVHPIRRLVGADALAATAAARGRSEQEQAADWWRDAGLAPPGEGTDL
ncbi:SDR family NAD(P)-dependent oxidoreductase [Nocardioides soli]|nr:SDR family NAD(P)-dependent oxidoreductase [Nocardioides soli]